MLYIVVVNGEAHWHEHWTIGNRGACMSARMSAKALGGQVWMVSKFICAPLP